MSRVTSTTLRRLTYVGLPTAGLAALGWYNYPRLKTLIIPGSTTIEVPVRVRGPDGKAMISSKTFPKLSEVEVDRKIRENASGQRTLRPNGLIWRYQTASLAANDGIEDAHSQSLVERDITPNAPPGDLLFFAVMDGHAGAHTSQLLSKALIPAVAAEISQLIHSSRPIPSKQSSSTLAYNYLKSFIVTPKSQSKSKSKSKSESNSNSVYEFDADPTYVSAALRSAFSTLDSRIINAPINLLSHIESQKDSELLSKPYEHPLAKDVLLPAMSGACAILAMLDTSRRDMYVACTGDSRVVAGYWDQPRDGSPGSWRAEVLSEDQTGRNPNELSRMQSEHPVEEAPFVIQRGRVLGGLEPTRAFGDARYKWPKDVADKLVENLLPPGSTARRSPQGLKTPPYVTADPVVTHRKLSFLPSPPSSTLTSTPSSSSSSTPSSTSTTPTPQSSDPTAVDSTLKFIVLATDGLWDQLSSKDVVALIGGHLKGIRSPAVKPSSIPVRETVGAEGVEGKTALKRLQNDKSSSTAASASASSESTSTSTPTPVEEKAKWTFVDDHIGTHLIRNALGGADKERVAYLASIPNGLARNFRDDITVTVVWYEQGKDGGVVESGNGSGSGEKKVEVKAKL